MNSAEDKGWINSIPNFKIESESNKDKKGRVWRQFFYHTEIVKSTQGIAQPHTIELHSIEMQKKQGSPGKDKVKELGQQIPNSFWTIQNLQKTGY